MYHYTVSHRAYSQATGCYPRPGARTHTAPMLRLYPYIRVGTSRLQSTGFYSMGTWGHGDMGNTVRSTVQGSGILKSYTETTAQMKQDIENHPSTENRILPAHTIHVSQGKVQA